MNVVFEIGKHVRCDILTWSGHNFGGKRTGIQVFPSGKVQGKVDSEDISSMVIRAYHGTRLILCTRATGDFEDAPWRCVRLVEGHTIPSEKKQGFPGVRVPDLDLLDKPSALRTDPGLQSSYPLVECFDDGDSWTFGSSGIPPIKGHVRRIIVEKDEGPQQRKLGEGEQVARAILTRARELTPDHLADLAAAATAELSAEAGEALTAWLDE